MNLGRASYGLVALAVVLLGATPVPARTGVSFDQLVFVTTARPLPQVTDFDAQWTSRLAKIQSDANLSQIARGRADGVALSFAYLGDMERLEDRARGTVTIFRPSDREVIHIDTVKRTYSITASNGVAQTYSVGAAPAASLPPGAPDVTAALQTTHDNFPNVVLDGFTYTGTAGRIIETVDDSRCAFAQADIFFVAYVDPTRAEPASQPPAYALFQYAAPELSGISGCHVTLRDDALGSLPPADQFALYRMTIMVPATRNIALQPMPENAPANVMMRGHVRTLTNADAALFAPPPGYVQVPTDH